MLLGYDPDRTGVGEDLVQLIALLVNQYPIVIEVDDAMTTLVELIDALIQRGSASVEEETLVLADR